MKQIPDFTLYKLDASAYTRDSIPANKPAIFSFFDVSCPHCGVTMKYLSGKYDKLKNASIHLVTLDGKTEVDAFMKVYGSKFLQKPNVMMLQDVDQEFIPKFQPARYPSVFVFGKNQELIIYCSEQRKMKQVLGAVKAAE